MQDLTMRARAQPLLSAAGLVLLGLVAGGGAGLVGASGRLDIVAILGGLVVSAAVFFSRNALLWFLIIGGLVVTGVSQLYFPGAKYLRYVVPLASTGLLLHAIIDQLHWPVQFAPEKVPAIVSWALVFLAVALVSALINFDGAGVAIMGLKGYFQMWVFFFGLVLVRWSVQTIRTIPRALLFIAFLQLPFALHQYLVLVPRRVGLGSGIVPVDIVAGTFGGAAFGGGANAVMAAFMLIVVACLLGLRKQRALSGIKTVVACLLLLAPIFITGAKIAAIYIPLMFFVLFYRDIVSKPFRFLMVGGAMFAVLAALLTALTITQPSGKLYSWSDLVDFTVERQTASISERGDDYSPLSRWTALTFWADEHVVAHPVHTLLGHGPGSSRVQERGLDLANTLAEERYDGLPIGYTSLSALLWDTGILGLVSVLAMFVAAFRTAGWLSNYYRDRDLFQAGLFDGLRAATAILMLSLAHKDYFAVNIPYQTLVLLIFGFLVVSRIQVAQKRDSQ